MKKTKIFALLALLLGIGVMIAAGTRLLETQRVYQEGDTAYEVLRSQVSSGPGPAMPQTGAESADTEAVKNINIPSLDIDFAALREINADAAAWLYCPDTVIDYPVMKADDYNYYLNHLADGTSNANGALFIDYNCAADFSEQLTVIYGHHMKSGKMFGSLKGYKTQSYYQAHPDMYLYTEQENYQIELLYGCVIGAGQWRERAFMYVENIDALLSYAEHNTTFKSNATYEKGDKLVVLSTCSYEFDGARYVVIGILR